MLGYTNENETNEVHIKKYNNFVLKNTENFKNRTSIPKSIVKFMKNFLEK